jgi:circadian clock protein KaiB
MPSPEESSVAMNRRRSFKFRLFVAGRAMNSLQAMANLKALCAKYLADPYEIEIVDVYQSPQRALAEGVLMTPTLIKVAPSPNCKIVGTLSQTPILLQMLGLERAAV